MALATLMPSEAEELRFIESLLGRPYHKTEFTCWHLVSLAQETLFDRKLGVTLGPNMSRRDELRMIMKHPERQRWEEVPRPVSGSIVMMKSGDLESHAGVWLRPDRGAILHCAAPHGVVYEQEAEILCRGVRQLVFYNPRS